MAKPFTQPVYSLGRSRIDLTKALSVSADLEDREILTKTGRTLQPHEMSDVNVLLYAVNLSARNRQR